MRLHLVGLVLGGCLLLGSSAATGGTTLAACDTDQVPMATTAGLGGKTVTGVVAAWTWGTSPCLLSGRLTFVVKRSTQRVSPGGAIRTITGNPGVAHISVVLKPGRIFTASWRWRNWCGRSGRFQLQPNFGNWPYLAVPSNPIRAPACTARGTPSALVRVPVRIRRCQAGDLHVGAGVGGGFMQSLIVGVGIALRAHHGACLLTEAKIELAVQKLTAGQWTTLQEVAGNPGERTIGALLSPGGERAQSFWAWRNWCGGAGSFRIFARVKGRAVGGAAFTDAPVCADSGSPSTLAPSFGHA